MWFRHGIWLLMAGGIFWGCAMVNGTPQPNSAPLFQAEATDTVTLQAVHREQEALLNTCTQHRSCDQVHFTRAMVALFENRETAVASFQHAIAAAPNGPLADSSALWIRFLSNPTLFSTSTDKPNRALLEVMKGTVRVWLGRQRGSGENVKSLDPAAYDLRRQIRTRDKRIAELTDQLHALKQIDLDSHGAGKLGLPRTPSK
ncbi:MAG TPA: hypothetical protein VJU54_11695 [Nitrospiraceae bacterium]|nr:hypothetical protein [Nitrospiraceae bacterium]